MSAERSEPQPEAADADRALLPEALRLMRKTLPSRTLYEGATYYPALKSNIAARFRKMQRKQSEESLQSAA